MIKIDISAKILKNLANNNTLKNILRRATIREIAYFLLHGHGSPESESKVEQDTSDTEYNLYLTLEDNIKSHLSPSQFDEVMPYISDYCESVKVTYLFYGIKAALGLHKSSLTSSL